MRLAVQVCHNIPETGYHSSIEDIKLPNFGSGGRLKCRMTGEITISRASSQMQGRSWIQERTNETDKIEILLSLEKNIPTRRASRIDTLWPRRPLGFDPLLLWRVTRPSICNDFRVSRKKGEVWLVVVYGWVDSFREADTGYLDNRLRLMFTFSLPW